jgi:hypothetical protein
MSGRHRDIHGRFRKIAVGQGAARLQEGGFERVRPALSFGTGEVRAIGLVTMRFAGMVPIGETLSLHEPLIEFPDRGALESTEGPLNGVAAIKVFEDPHVTKLVRCLMLLSCAVRVSEACPVFHHVPELCRRQSSFVFQQHLQRLCQLRPASFIAVGLQQRRELFATNHPTPIRVTGLRQGTEHAGQSGAAGCFTPSGATHKRVPRLRSRKPVVLVHTGTIHRVQNCDSERINFAGGLLDQTGVHSGFFNRGERHCFGMDFVQQSVQPSESFHRTHCTSKQTDVRLFVYQEMLSEQAICTFRDHETTTVVVTRSLVIQTRLRPADGQRLVAEDRVNNVLITPMLQPMQPAAGSMRITRRGERSGGCGLHR